MHRWGTRPVSPRRNPEEPWDVTITTSSLTRRTYWCAPSACEEDLELQDLPSGGYAYRVGHAFRAGGDAPWLQGDVASAQFGEVLAAFSPMLSRLLDHHRYQASTISDMQTLLAQHRQLQAHRADFARQTGLHRDHDFDLLGPYDAFSPHSVLHGDDEWSEAEELYSWD